MSITLVSVVSVADSPGPEVKPEIIQKVGGSEKAGDVPCHAEKYVYEKNWSLLYDSFNIAVDSKDNVYEFGLTAFDGSPTVIKYDRDGHILANWTTSLTYNGGCGVIAVDAQDNVYVGGWKRYFPEIGEVWINKLEKYSSNGTHLGDYNLTGIFGLDKTYPILGIAIDSHNDMYVMLYGFGSCCGTKIFKLNSNGEKICRWDTGDGFNDTAYSLTVDSHDNIWTGNGKKYDSSGNLLFNSGIDFSSYTLTADGEGLIYTPYWSGGIYYQLQLLQFDQSGLRESLGWITSHSIRTITMNRGGQTLYWLDGNQNVHLYAKRQVNPRIDSITPSNGQAGSNVTYELAGCNLSSNPREQPLFSSQYYVNLTCQGQNNITSIYETVPYPLNASGTFSIPANATPGLWNVSVHRLGSYSNDNVQFLITNNQTTYNITAMAGPGGSISPSGVISVQEGGDQTFTITPDTGKVIESVLVDGVSVGSVNTYTFKKVGQDHTIDAAFKEIPCYAEEWVFEKEWQLPYQSTTIAVDSKNYIYQAGRNAYDDPNSHVVKYDQDGNVLARWDTDLQKTTYCEIAIDSEDNVYVGGIDNRWVPYVGYVASNKIQKFSSSGIPLADYNLTNAFGLEDAYPVYGLTLDSHNNLYVLLGYVQSTLSGIYKLNSTGQSVSHWILNEYPGVLGPKAGHIVADSFDNIWTELSKYDPSGNLLLLTDADGPGVAADKKGTTYIINDPSKVPGTGAFSLVRYDPSGLREVNGMLSINGQGPLSMTLDHSGQTLFIVGLNSDGFSHNVSVFSKKPVIPSIDSITPSIGQAGTNVNYHLSGCNLSSYGILRSEYPVNLTYPGQKNITSLYQSDFGHPNPFQGWGTFSIPANATPGLWNVSAHRLGAYSNDNVQFLITNNQTAYNITATASPGGSISPSGVVSVQEGGDQTFTITPDNCYSITELLIDGELVDPAVTYTFSNVITDHTIEAHFSRIINTIYATAGTGGTITPNGTVHVLCGESQTFTITPDSGYAIADVIVDGGSIGPVSPVTLSGDHTIHATFASQPTNFTITATAGPGGSISPPGVVSVPEGGSKTFTIAPNTGYQIADVQVDGRSEGPVPTYTFTNVIASHTIHATFISSDQYIINSTANSWSIIAPKGKLVYPATSNPGYITQAKPGATLSDVLVDNESVGTVEYWTFTNLSSDHTIHAESNPKAGQVLVFFDAAPRAGKAPLVVQFTDQSYGTPNTWYWSFGDGSHASTQHPQHTFTVPGVYTVSLRAYNDQSGGTAQSNNLITVIN